MIKILLVEDSLNEARLLELQLKKCWHEFKYSFGHVDLLKLVDDYIAENSPDIILLDLGLPDSQGIETFRNVYSKHKNLPLVILTGTDDKALAKQALAEGAQDYLVKGQFDHNGLIRAINYSLERKIQIKKLEESEQSFRNLIESNYDGIIIVTELSTVVYANPAAEKLFGKSEKELLGEQIGFPIIPGVKNDIDILRGNSEIISVENYIVETTWNGKKVFLCSLRDITDRKKAQEAIKQSESKFRSVIESASDAIIIGDKDGNITLWNKGAQNIFGYSHDEILNDHITVLLSENQQNNPASVQSDFIKSWQENFTSPTVELEGIRKNGDPFPILMSLSSWKAGSSLCFSAIIKDISEAKRAKEALEEQEQQFRSLFENSTLGIYRKTPDGKILMANPAFINMLGFESFEVLRKWNEHNIGYVNQSAHDSFNDIVEREGVIYGYEEDWIKEDGTIITLRESGRAIYGSSKNIIYYECTVEDISHIKAAQLALVEAKDKAEKSMNLKSEFLSQVSHEIRTPINIIINMSNLLKDELGEKHSKETSETIESIDTASKQMVRSMDLILNVSELISGTYEPDFHDVDIYKDILDPLVAEFETTAKRKKLALILNRETDDSLIHVDKYSAKQIFSNLIDNAIKFTKKGKVEITAIKNEIKQLTVKVSDTGIGISPSFSSYLFDEFSQEDHGFSRKFDGIGLGLSAVKRFSELNKLKIDVESERKVGTTFTITFPK